MDRNSNGRPLRMGILGTARIARKFVAGVRPSKHVQVTGVASRDADKARQFARDQALLRSFDSYERMICDPDIDAVYNPLPNSLHAEWSIRALEAGKHVLCEKPLTFNERDARKMFDTAKRRGLHLAEAFPYRAQPQTLKLEELIQRGTIGAVRHIHATFAFTLTDPEDIRLRPDLHGGALMDLGIYPVSLVRMIAKQRPVRVRAVARWNGDQEEAVDRTLAGTLEFHDGLMAQLMCSFDAALHREALIVGSGGTIHTTFRNHTSAEEPGDLRLREGADGDARESVIRTESTNGFLAEADSFAGMVHGSVKQWSGATAAESIDNAMTVRALLESAHAGGAAVELSEGTCIGRPGEDIASDDPGSRAAAPSP